MARKPRQPRKPRPAARSDPAPADPPAGLAPAALTVADAAALLGVETAVIAEHVDAGLPTDHGRINLVTYAAWLIQRTG